jgi:Predicted membrane protein
MSAWPVEPSVSLPIMIAAVVYLRGWHRLRQRLPRRFEMHHATMFLTGLAILLLALAAPVERLTHQFLSAHMVQHLLLMVVVAPMLWMSAPVAPLFVGLPRPIRGILLALTHQPDVRRLTRWCLHPSVGWIAFAASFWIWHAPALYDLALRADRWHHVEHACFLVSGLLFWRPVILPWPARSTWPRWSMIPYLALAMFQSLPLAAILTFSDRVIYASYSSLDDQAFAGALMWVPGSIPLLLPILSLVIEVSSGHVDIEKSHA